MMATALLSMEEVSCPPYDKGKKEYRNGPEHKNKIKQRI